MAAPLYPRFAHDAVVEALADTPVVAVNGARQVGKSTLVQQVVDQHPGARLVTLDDAIHLEAARADPGAFVDHDGLLVIDEVQRAPELLPAIKASVDRSRTPGRFLLTGSTRLLTVAETSDSLTGRIEIIDLWPLSQGELRGRREQFVDALFERPHDLLVGSDLTRHDYDDLIVAGGFPEPHGREGSRRRAWFANYATTVLERMIQDTADIDRMSVMPRLLRLCAARTSGELNVADIARYAGVPYRTVGSYLSHLQAVFLVQLAPAWSRNLTSKVVHRPKVVIADSGLAAHLMGVNADGLAKPGGPIGALLETFVTTELRKQIAHSDVRPELLHFRDRGGTEVDLLLEAPDGRIVGIEVKASTTVRRSDFAGLGLLADRLGEQFCAGIVLHRGHDAARFGDRLAAVPVSALWDVQ